MSTVLEIITSGRFDLRDENKTQYTDSALVDVMNRGIRVLCSVLGSMNSDWVNTEEDLSLLISSNSVALPSDFSTPIGARIDKDELTKKSVSFIRTSRLDSYTGQPAYYAIQGNLLIVESTVSEPYTIALEYNKIIGTLIESDNMPFNDEFNDILRSFIIMTAKARNEYSVISDAAIQDYFYSAAFSKLISRTRDDNYKRTNF